MHSFFYWSGAVLWGAVALTALLAALLLMWAVIVAVAKACSILRFTLALRRKRGAEPETARRWFRSFRWVLIQAWEDNGSLEIAGHDDSRWRGIGKWSVNDEPWPQTQQEPASE